MNRIAVYVYYDKEGELRDYAIHSIKALLDIADKVIVVFNGKMKTLEVDKLQSPKIEIIERENKGYDFWGYREAFLSLSDCELENCEELIFTNNSVFGPVFPYSALFGTMKSRDVDFWGITKHPDINKNVKRFDFTTKIKTHIQTYFMVFRNRMINSPEFRDYFCDLPKVKSKKDAIAKIEIKMTRYFAKRGFEYDTYVCDEVFDLGVANAMQYLPDVMLEKYNVPFIKKTAFGARYDLAQRESLGSRTSAAFDFIKTNTKYDTKLITDEIIRDYSYDNIAKFLHLNYILSDTQRQNFSPDKACIIYDCDDEDINKIAEPYLKNLYGLIDIYIINRNNIDFSIQDVKLKFFSNDLSYLRQISNMSKSYKYFYIFMNNDKTFDSMPKLIKTEYVKHILNCSIASKYYISNVFDTFKNNPFLGLLTPAPFMTSGFKLYRKEINKKEIKSFEKLYGEFPNISSDYISSILPAFWITKDAFNSVDECIDLDDKEGLNKAVTYTLLLTRYGLYTGRISTVKIMQNYIDNLDYRFSAQDDTLSDLAYKLRDKQ